MVEIMVILMLYDVICHFISYKNGWLVFGLIRMVGNHLNLTYKNYKNEVLQCEEIFARFSAAIAGKSGVL